MLPQVGHVALASIILSAEIVALLTFKSVDVSNFTPEAEVINTESVPPGAVNAV